MTPHPLSPCVITAFLAVFDVCFLHTREKNSNMRLLLVLLSQASKHYEIKQLEPPELKATTHDNAIV